VTLRSGLDRYFLHLQDLLVATEGCAPGEAEAVVLGFDEHRLQVDWRPLDGPSDLDGDGGRLAGDVEVKAALAAGPGDLHGLAALEEPRHDQFRGQHS
jgi:hypothetical protein